MSNKILTVGSSSMDLSMNLYKLPEAGQRVSDDGGVAYTPGGGGVGAAVAFARLGGESALCTKLGADVHGQRLYSFFKDAGIITSYIKVDNDYPTGFSVIMKEAGGSERAVLYPGANGQLNSENILAAFDFAPDALFLGLELPLSVAVSAAKIAAAQGIPIFIDAAAQAGSQPLENLPKVEIFSLNEEETLEYTGIRPTGTDSCLRAAYTLYTKVKCKYIVIKLGSRGAFIYDGKHCDLISAYKPDRVQDVSGADNAFVAAMTLEYLRNGGSITGAVNYGCAAAAVAVSKRGGLSSAPSDGEVREFIEKRRA